MAEYTLVEQNNITLKYSVIDQDDAVVNLSGATIDWSIKTSASASASIAKSTTTSGLTITNASGGLFEVYILPADTENLAINDITTRYYMEAVITDTGGNVYTITNDDIQPDELNIRPIYTEAS